MGKVATYDPAGSNVGYLYLTEDHAITRDTRSLVQAIAATRPMLSRTTEPMLDAISAGRIAIAYNVVGPYALTRAMRDANIRVVFPRDYTIIASRVAFIARDARHPAAARLFLDFLLSRTGQTLLARQWLLPVRADVRAPACPRTATPDPRRAAASSISIRSSAAASWPTGAPLLLKRPQMMTPIRTATALVALMAATTALAQTPSNDDLAALVRQQAAEIATLRARLDRLEGTTAAAPAPVAATAPAPTTPPAPQLAQSDTTGRDTVTRPFAPQLVPPARPNATWRRHGRPMRRA